MNSQNVFLFDEIQSEIRELLSRDFYVLGQETKAFEQEFAEYMGVKHCICVASGTTALVLLLRISKLPKGSKVLVPAFTPIPTTMAVIEAGFTPEFVDIDPETLTLDIQKLERHLDKDVKAIIPVHIFGKLCPLDQLNDFASTYQLQIIEDACQAVGSKHPKYSIAEYSVGAGMSFYPTKNLGCWGDGGAILTNHDYVAEKLITLRHYGLNAKFESQSQGANHRIDELQALVLRKKLQTLSTYNEKRNQLASRWKSILNKDRFQPLIPDEFHNYHVISYLCDNPEQKELIRQSFADEGLKSKFFYDHPVSEYSGINIRPKFKLTQCEWICERVINLHDSDECFRILERIIAQN